MTISTIPQTESAAPAEQALSTVDRDALNIIEHRLRAGYEKGTGGLPEGCRCVLFDFRPGHNEVHIWFEYRLPGAEHHLSFRARRGVPGGFSLTCQTTGVPVTPDALAALDLLRAGVEISLDRAVAHLFWYAASEEFARAKEQIETSRCALAAYESQKALLRSQCKRQRVEGKAWDYELSNPAVEFVIGKVFRDRPGYRSAAPPEFVPVHAHGTLAEACDYLTEIYAEQALEPLRPAPIDWAAFAQ